VSVDYGVTLAGDAHFTRDNEVLTAKNIIAHHNFVLDGFGQCAPGRHDSASSDASRSLPAPG
jgi:hypothetical protein